MRATRLEGRERDAFEVEIEGRRLRLSSPDRVLWPKAGFTKAELLAYYAHVAPALLPHIAGRPLTLGRFPEGVERYGWYQTECRGHPEWLRTLAVAGRTGKGQRYCVLDDLPSLLWAANIGGIELHPFLARADRIDEPTHVVFDLDPGPPAGTLECWEVALRLRRVLAEVGLESFPKTSGSVGAHVYVPLNADHTYDQTKSFARAVAHSLAGGHPDLVVATTGRAARTGKVLVDWGQNDRIKSLIAAYSLRAMPFPTVSTPLTWDEVERAVDERRPDTLAFGPEEVLERVDRCGDLFRPVLELAQTLPL